MGVDGEPSQPVTVPGHRFVRAVEWVTELHGAQARKGGDVPYVAHLLEVARWCSRTAARSPRRSPASSTTRSRTRT